MRLELSDGNSHKFWEITKAGKSLLIRWGRIGTKGQEQTKSFASPEAAQKEHDKLVASKRKKGYVEVGGRAAGKTKASGGTRAKPAKRTASAPAPAPQTFQIAGGLPPTRPVRDHALSWYTSDAPLEAALKHPDRIRAVSATEASASLKKLRRIHMLDLSMRGAMPAWLGELRHLRTLQAGGRFDRLSASVLKLPHLRFLHLDNSNLKALDGIDKLPALQTVTFNDTTLGDDEAAVAAQRKRLKGATGGDWGAGYDFKPKQPKPPRDKKQLVKAINDDTLRDESDLRKVDLSGARFEDAYITHDLRGAKLANTIWVRCDFEWATLAGADLTGATFYDCYFNAVYKAEGNLAKVKAPGITFVGCGGELQLPKADVRNGRMLDMDDDVSIDLQGANAQGLVMQVQFCSEKEHRFEMKGADLRGAQLRVDITADRRAELKRKKTARLAWKANHFKSAKTDKTTRIEYMPLDRAKAAPPTRPAVLTFDPNGKVAEILGPIHASNASLWLVVADADVATKWRGAVDENDRKDDFKRALSIEDKKIAIGSDGEGVVVRIGFNAWSHVFRDATGIRVVDAHLDGDRPERDRAIALRMAQWPVTTKPKTIAKLACPSGIAALMLPYQSGNFPAKMRAKANAGKFVVEPLDYDRALVPLPKGPGSYEIVRYPLRPEKMKGDTYEDDAGEYGDVIEIAYRSPLRGK